MPCNTPITEPAISRQLGCYGPYSNADDNNTAARSELFLGGGEYLMMNILLGTPPKNIIAIMDTGSDLTWTQMPALQTLLQPNRPSLWPENLLNLQACKYLGKVSLCDLKKSPLWPQLNIWGQNLPFRLSPCSPHKGILFGFRGLSLAADSTTEESLVESVENKKNQFRSKKKLGFLIPINNQNNTSKEVYIG